MSGDPKSPSSAAHWLGFVASGCIAASVDIGVLALLTYGVGLSPLVARLLSISCAMVAGFLSHRKLTFAVPTPPNVTEFVRFIGVAWTSSAVNYGAFAAILFVVPATSPILALLLATALSTCVTYIGLRFGVFRRT